MKHFSIVFVAVLALVGGCKKKDGDAAAGSGSAGSGAAPSGGGGDCSAAIGHSMDLSKAEMAKMGMDDKMLAKMTEIAVKHCTADGWSAEALKCMTDATDMKTAQGCYGKLTPAQRDQMNKAAAAQMQPPKTGGDAPTAGSDTGSAGSGSAAATDGSGSAK